jgi:hypothetical protein
VDLPVPPQFRFKPDVSAADWFASALKPWGKDRVRLWSFLPDTFEGYVRFPNHLEHDFEAHIDEARLRELALVLEGFTKTPDSCFVAAWVGWGSWGPGSSAMLTAARKPPRGRKSRSRFIFKGGKRWRDLRAIERAGLETQRKLNALPQIRTESREYFLFTSKVADVPSFAIGGFPQTRSIWWPDDRAWCVATEVDGYDSYVGGSQACIDAVLASDLLRAGPIEPDTPVSR